MNKPKFIIVIPYRRTHQMIINVNHIAAVYKEGDFEWTIIELVTGKRLKVENSYTQIANSLLNEN